MNRELTDIDIKAIAKLAKIDLGTEQAERIKNELAQFMEFAQILSDFEIDGLSSDNTHGDVFRKDTESKDTYSSDNLISPSRISNGYISVPLTVEENRE